MTPRNGTARCTPIPALRVLSAASRQGVDLSGVREIEPSATHFDQPASIPPQSLWTKLVGAALAVGATRQPDGQQVVDAVINTPVAGAVDLARQATNVANGEGRRDQVQEFPEQPDVYSSALLDGDTCDSCGNNDGVDYPTLDEALEDYPDGPYKDCYGSDRCRCSLVFVWPEDNPGDPEMN